VTLAISLGSADTVYAKLLDQLEPSLKTTAGASPHMADHLCCGNMGRCESLFTTGRRLMRREAVEGSRRLARVVIARARKAGHFCLAANGFEYRIFDPGFFRGVSGSAIPCCAWRRHPACRPSPPSKRRPPACGPRDPLVKEHNVHAPFRRPVAGPPRRASRLGGCAGHHPSLGAGLRFHDTPPTVPASRLIPQAMADAARLSDFRATVDLAGVRRRHRPVARRRC
jgi:hypothetical protein